jgi:hypothetical protein
MTENKKETAIAVSSPTQIVKELNTNVKVFDPEQEIENAQRAAKALMKVVEATKPLEMNGKKYLYFEHWQTIARFFNLSVGIEWTKPIMHGDKVHGFEAKSSVYDRGGMVIGGAEAACMRDEKQWAIKPEFQLRSMAQTRAMAKGLRSILGYVAVLAGVEATPAEEIDEPKEQKKNSLVSTFMDLIKIAKTDDEMVGIAKQIEAAKQAGKINNGEIMTLRGLYGAKEKQIHG